MAYINGNKVLFQGVGTRVKINGATQGEWNADFVENEKLKTKNLFPVPYYQTCVTYNGIEFTANADGTVSVVGAMQSAIGTTMTLVKRLFLKAGTYTFSVSKNSGYVIQTATNGYFNFVDVGQTINTFTLSEDRLFEDIYIAMPTNSTESINDTYITIQLEKGDKATEYVAYDGEIIHKKDVAKSATSINIRGNQELMCGNNTWTPIIFMSEKSEIDLITTGKTLVLCGSVYAKVTEGSMFYRLFVDGVDITWTNICVADNQEYHSLPMAWTYNNIPAGKHTFELRVCANLAEASVIIPNYVETPFTLFEI